MKVTWPPPNRRIGFVDALGLMGLVGLLIARFVPIARLVPFWGCALRERTGWPCLGCGLTRVADHVSHGDVLAAWDANPLGTVAALLFVLAILVSFLHLAFAMPIPHVALTAGQARGLRVALIVAVVANYAFVIVKTRFPHLL